MGEVRSLDQLSLVLGYIVPGLIILYVRAQFLTGRVAAQKDNVLAYFTLSAIYLAIFNGLLPFVTNSDQPLNEQTRYWLLINLGGAALFGALIGINAATGCTRRLLLKCGMRLPHVLDTAWDWKFSRIEPTLMTITLKDGTRVSGWCGEGSFIGSDPKDRDLYLSQIYDVDDNGNWSIKTQGKAVYISSGEIRLIEFIPPIAGESHEQG